MIKLSKSEKERASNIHKNSIVIDAHTDVIMDVAERRDRGEKRVLERRHLETMRQGGITARVFAVGGDCEMFYTFPLRGMLFGGTDPLKRTLKLIDLLHTDVYESRDLMLLAFTADDIEQAKKDGKVAIMFSLEGGKPFEEDLSFLRVLYRLGVRIVQLTWNRRNLLAGGVFQRTNSGLTDLGIEVIEEINRLGIVIDVSHLSETSFWDVLELTKEPVIASHSNARALCDHVRNLTDDQIKALAENDGVIGVNSYTEFVSKNSKATIENLLDHVGYIERLVGVDHIGIGLDITEDWPEEIYERIWGEKLRFTQGLESIRELQNFTEGLVARGYSDDELKKILGGNFLRVFKEVFKK